MTSRELQIAVITDLEGAGFSRKTFSEDLFRVMTEAQEQLFRNYFEVFETSRLVTDVLQGLVRRSVSLTAAPGEITIKSCYIDRYLLPADFGYYLSGHVSTAYNFGGIEYILNGGIREPSGTVIEQRRLVRHVQSDDILRLLADPFSKPTYVEPLVTIGDNQISVYTDPKFLTTEFYLDYIAQPDPITETVEPSLPVREHPRLATLTTQLLLQRLTSPTPSTE